MKTPVSFLGTGLGAVGLSLVLNLSAAPPTFTPGGLETVGLTRLVPDTQLFTTNSVPNLDNWEPYSSVLGNSVFLISFNTFAVSYCLVNKGKPEIVIVIRSKSFYSLGIEIDDNGFTGCLY